MRQILTIMILGVSTAISAATLSAYHLGNSLTDEFDGIPTIAASMNDVLTMKRTTIPGCGTQCLWEGAGLPADFVGKSFDIINQLAFANGTELGIDADVTYISKYYDEALKNNPNCRLCVFTQWTGDKTKTWESQWHAPLQTGWTTAYGCAAYHEALVTALRARYPGKQISLMPVGHVLDAFQHLAAQGGVPGYSGVFDLYADYVHLNTQGKYLQNLTGYCVYFRKDPHGAGLSFQQWSGTETVSQAFADIAYDLVWETVQQLSDLTNVGTPNPNSVVARLTANKTTGAAPLTVAFDGSGSAGMGLAYAWRFGDGQAGSGAQISHIYQTAGTFTAKLIVTGAVNKDSAQTTITVLDPGSALRVSTAAVTPTIDGTEDAGWQNATAQSIAHAVLGTTASQADFSGQFKTMWDNDNLYVIVKVTDNISSTSASVTYQNDGVEVYVDGDNSKGSSYDANDVQYRVVRGKTSLEASGTGHSTNVVFAQHEEAGGYTVEFKLPWASIGAVAAAAKMIGLEVHITDNDGTAERKTILAWAGTTDDAWANPAVFGTAQLSDVATAAKPAAEIRRDASPQWTVADQGAVELIDVRGCKVSGGSDVSQQSRGVYLMRTSNGKGAVACRRLILGNSRGVK